MVSINAIAVKPSAIRPKAPRRLALVANIVSVPSTGLAMLGGTSVCRKYFSSPDWKLLNIGNAVNTASITVSSGTSEISVVNVRLLAVRPSRSSRKRSRSVRSVSNQGQSRSVVSTCDKRVGAVVAGSGSVMPAIMPAMPDTTSPAASRPDRVTTTTRASAVATTLALIALCAGWELVWARLGHGTLVLKALPLALALPGLLRHRMLTYRWLSLAIWLYVAEGAVRDADAPPVRLLAALELALALALFAACATQVRWRLAAARRRA